MSRFVDLPDGGFVGPRARQVFFHRPAKAAPPPDEATALTDVWADGGAQWRT